MARELCDFEEKLAAFDEESFGVFTRRLQVLLIRGDEQRARALFDEYLRKSPVTPPSMQDHVAAVFPVRVAMALEQRGYRTVMACDRAKDIELLSVRNVSVKTLAMIREKCSEIRRRERELQTA